MVYIYCQNRYLSSKIKKERKKERCLRFPMRPMPSPMVHDSPYKPIGYSRTTFPISGVHFLIILFSKWPIQDGESLLEHHIRTEMQTYMELSNYSASQLESDPILVVTLGVESITGREATSDGASTFSTFNGISIFAAEWILDGDPTSDAESASDVKANVEHDWICVGELRPGEELTLGKASALNRNVLGNRLLVASTGWTPTWFFLPTGDMVVMV